MKKLIPAIVLLLISAIVMSTASYAWFSMNSTVSATGMQVKAATEGSLYISRAATQPNYKDIKLSTVDFVELDASDDPVIPELYPTSTVNVADWYYVGAAAADSYLKNADNFTKVAVASEESYFVKKTVWIRSENDFSTLKISAVDIDPNFAQGATDDAFEGAVTVAFKVVSLTAPAETGTGTATATNANPVFVSNEATSYRHGGVAANVTDHDNDATTEDVDIGQETSLTFVPAPAANTTIWTKTGSTSVANYTFQVDIYVYFDGQSESCYSNALLNAIAFDATVGVTFTAA